MRFPLHGGACVLRESVTSEELSQSCWKRILPRRSPSDACFRLSRILLKILWRRMLFLVIRQGFPRPALSARLMGRSGGFSCFPPHFQPPPEEKSRRRKMRKQEHLLVMMCSDGMRDPKGSLQMPGMDDAPKEKEEKKKKERTEQESGEQERTVSNESSFSGGCCLGCFCILLSLILGLSALWIGFCAWIRCFAF